MQALFQQHPFSGDYRHEKIPRLPFGQRKSVNFKSLLGRFVTALFGGVARVGPMLLMVLHNDRTTSAAVFLVVVFVAACSTAPPEIIISVVAAYAADW